MDIIVNASKNGVKIHQSLVDGLLLDSKILDGHLEVPERKETVC